jgi:hypothetical protein
MEKVTAEFRVRSPELGVGSSNPNPERRNPELRTSLLLICDDQPRSAVATVDSKLRSDSQLGARGTEKGINILSLTVVPEVVGDQDFDADLPLDHAAIITSDLARSRQLEP